MRLLSILLIIFMLQPALRAQALLPDSASRAATLPEALVTAFADDAPIARVAGALSVVDSTQLLRGNTASLVGAINQNAGVRAEERSPGSYRLSIRGSTLRAPFGVRNVKIYLRDIPLTDPGGFSYFNALPYSFVSGIEILKGPGSSLYGAGTGGVMLVHMAEPDTGLTVQAGLSAGSYGFRQLTGRLSGGSAGLRHSLAYEHTQSTGYRVQSALRRDAGLWTAQARLGKGSSLYATVLLNDLFYETPGGLTRSEFTANPRAARPRAGKSPGAVEAGAAIRQTNALAGLSLQQALLRNLELQMSGYASGTRHLNPAIRNYARTLELGYGGRATLSWSRSFSRGAQLQVRIGAELQQQHATQQTFENRNGQPDTLRESNELGNAAGFVFVQTRLALSKWVFSAGASIYEGRATLYPLLQPPVQLQSYPFTGGVSPRFSALWQPRNAQSVYTVLSRGFSPPTLAELAPTGSGINAGLRAEHGWNVELGTRGQVSDRLSYDAALFCFLLDRAIVQRRDAFGGDYYTNAGGARQAGLELQLSYRLPLLPRIEAQIWGSYTYYYFRYRQFVQLEQDYSGNDLPGAAPHAAAAGIDITTPQGWYAHLTGFYNSETYLNDANTTKAAAFATLGARLGWKGSWLKTGVELFAGVDNATDARYSLGYDINAFGGRYYNAAPGRSFYAGLEWRFAR